ncbi:hypothetical protein P691DRAFT_760194 [Macrolepiota fuliginosa MF-IS2]|uniref:Uncharacterized protein n=1 Tax=Macrolepiota fuliginosa MF-IS2 TaxID=1400762 RepID=A0A9P5XE02_9AGAR|nr:hypothetical protein P691DRAFT_760194 [Macrolepiota fuliginosa MF-IS2]
MRLTGFAFYVALTVIGVYLSEVILCLRFWLMWNNDKRLIAATLVTLLGTGTYFFYFGESRTLAGTFVDSPLPGCAFIEAKQTVYFDVIVAFIYDVGRYPFPVGGASNTEQEETQRCLTHLSDLICVSCEDRSQTYFVRGSIIKQFYHEGFQYYVFAVTWSGMCLFLSIQSPEGALVVAPLLDPSWRLVWSCIYAKCAKGTDTER